MDSINKIYFDFDKLWPKIGDWRHFEMPNFYYFSVKEKLAKNTHFFHFETLSLDYESCIKLTTTNFEFGTTLILWLFSKYALKMPKNA